MSADEFRDALNNSVCNADGDCFDLNHALNCPWGCLVNGRPNEIQGFNRHPFELAGLKQMTPAPILSESDENGENGLRADWGLEVFGNFKKWIYLIWASLTLILLLTKANHWHQPLKIKIKITKQRYSKAAEIKPATFIPFIATYDAALDKEAEMHIEHLASLLSKNGMQ